MPGPRFPGSAGGSAWSPLSRLRGRLCPVPAFQAPRAPLPGPRSAGGSARSPLSRLHRRLCLLFTFCPSPHFLAQTGSQYKLRESISVSTNGSSITKTSTSTQHHGKKKIKEPVKPKKRCEIKHCPFYQNDIIKTSHQGHRSFPMLHLSPHTSLVLPLVSPEALPLGSDTAFS